MPKDVVLWRWSCGFCKYQGSGEGRRDGDGMNLLNVKLVVFLMINDYLAILCDPFLDG